jgi:hypothetical protein
MPNPSYKIIESFTITGRGLVVAIDEAIDFGVGKKLDAKIIRPDGTILETIGYQEWLLRKQPVLVEKTAVSLIGIEKSQVPSGSFLRIDGYMA